jgi:uncharacterized protein YjbI with pentapeptide repeats
MLSDFNLRNADFRDAFIEGICIDGVDLRGADFSGSEIYWGNFFMSNCEGCLFRKARLQGACLDSVNFRAADFSGACISHDNLLSPSTLLGADFSGAFLDDAKMSGCEYNSDTIFPEGFDPQQKGLVLTEEKSCNPGPPPGCELPYAKIRLT